MGMLLRSQKKINKSPLQIMFTVINFGLSQGSNYNARLKHDFSVMFRSLIGFRSFGQVINRVGNVADLVINRVRVLRSGPHPHPLFLGVSPGENLCTARWHLNGFLSQEIFNSLNNYAQKTRFTLIDFHCNLK